MQISACSEIWISDLSTFFIFKSKIVSFTYSGGETRAGYLFCVAAFWVHAKLKKNGEVIPFLNLWAWLMYFYEPFYATLMFG